MSKIKLKPKQQAVLQDIQNQKAQLQKLFADLNGKESLVLELIFEEHGVVGTISNVKLDKDILEYELTPVKSEKTKKIKVKEKVNTTV